MNKKLTLILKASGYEVFKKSFEIDNQTFHMQYQGLEFMVSDMEEYYGNESPTIRVLTSLRNTSFTSKDEKQVIDDLIKSLRRENYDY